MDERVDRRNFIGSLGVAATVAATAYVAAPRAAGAAANPKGKIPTTPFKVGHMTFPLRRRRQETEIRVSGHEYSLLGRRIVHGGCIQNLAQRKADRTHPSGLQLRPSAIRSLQDRG